MSTLPAPAVKETKAQKSERLKLAKNPWEAWDEVREFARQVEDWDVELVYGNTLQTFYAIETAHHLNLPSVWNPRESEPWQTYFDFLPTEIARRALECFSYPYRIVFVSSASQDVWRPLNSRHNYMVIHNGLNRERFAAALRRWWRKAPKSGAMSWTAVGSRRGTSTCWKLSAAGSCSREPACPRSIL